MKYAESKQCKLEDLPIDKLKSFSDLIEDDIYSVLTLEGSLKARNHTGGTAPEQVKRQIEDWQKRLT